MQEGLRVVLREEDDVMFGKGGKAGPKPKGTKDGLATGEGCDLL